jgi:CDP-glucose 4,6-dehydratase
VGDLVGMLRKGFKGKKVLVTGDTGFKGSWLSLWLAELGAEVTGYALPPERENDHFRLLKLDKTIHHMDADVRDGDKVISAFSQVKPEFVFHLAAQPLVRLSYQEPKRTFDTNVGGTVNILEAARLTPSVRSLVTITSDKCYRNKEWVWGYRENDELGGHDPYSASKAAAEVVFSGYLSSFFQNREDIGVASARAGNVIGGGDWSTDRIVPDSVKALMDNKPILVRNPKATRPWQHVLEPLSGYLTLALKLAEKPLSFNSSWNFGPGNDSMKTVDELVKGLIKEWGLGMVEYLQEKKPVHEAGLLFLNCDKSRNQLGWKPAWDFDETVHETAFWYKQYKEGADIRQTSLAQIKKYMEK